ncbi:hypothetical protein [Enterobacter sp.]|uniref:hypothetical protein n=1 Tax=Enterobacter sp. TaxID=42895 RepID=UPI0029027909|nr:hypothetical protein [Enterobacter sp.]MDU1920101.1 hypothetical protein [Enterobacter sp.]MDU2002042.1 hypothetical protein [Enterobacter hormaechei]MDU2013730.1 hypothetical protein [Enterobacter hormaechei]
MPDLLNTWLMLLQDSAVGETVRNARYLFPVLESLHILGISLLVGPAFTFDLRLLGMGRRIVPVTLAARYLLPVSHTGLLIVVITGLALLSAQATVIAAAGAAPWKSGLIIVAGLNVLVFHKGIYRSVANWDLDVLSPLPARLSALVSALVWTGVIIAGRFLAY